MHGVRAAVAEPQPSQPFPLWQTAGALGLGAAAGALWWQANSEAHAASQLSIHDEAGIRQYLAKATAARAWQDAAIGAGVAATGLGVWALIAALGPTERVTVAPAWTTAGPGAAVRLAF